jgi:hypothetical protein
MLVELEIRLEKDTLFVLSIEWYRRRTPKESALRCRPRYPIVRSLEVSSN